MLERQRHMKLLSQCLVILACAGTLLMGESQGGDPEAIAVAIVYDTSGSMGDSIQGRPKFRWANHALLQVVEKMNVFVKEGHKVYASLVTFREEEGIPLSLFQASNFKQWAESFSDPRGNTPLGEAILRAAVPLQSSRSARQHLVVITDGDNNSGIAPSRALAKLASAGKMPCAYFIAFDMQSGSLKEIAKEGALVLDANDGVMLEKVLTTLFAEKILLEDEATPLNRKK